MQSLNLRHENKQLSMLILNAQLKLNPENDFKTKAVYKKALSNFWLMNEHHIFQPFEQEIA